jgi:hypothetical protein
LKARITGADPGVDVPAIQAIVRHTNSMTTTRLCTPAGCRQESHGRCVRLAPPCLCQMTKKEDQIFIQPSI